MVSRKVFRVVVLAFVSGGIWLAWAASAEAGPVEDAVGGLSSADAEARTAAADALAEMGQGAKAAVGALAKALEDSDATVRWHAARALGAIGPGAAAATGSLAKHLGDADPLVRAHAAHSIGQIGTTDRAVIGELVKHATDPDATVRRSVVRAIVDLNPGEDVVLPILIDALDDADSGVLMAAIDTMAEFGAEVVPGLVDALADPKAQYWATLVLAEIGPDAEAAVPGLTALLKSDRAELRMQALIALGEIGEASASSGSAIAACLNDDQVAVRYAATFALARSGSSAGKQELEREVESNDPFLQLLAAWALAVTSDGDSAAMRRAVELAVNGLQSDQPQVITAAARAMQDLDVPPEVAGPALLQAVTNGDAETRGNIAAAIAGMGPEIVPRVINGLKHESPLMQMLAVDVLGRMGIEGKEAAGELAGVLKSDDAELVREAQFALASMGADASVAVPALVESLGSEHDRVRYSACYALGSIGPGAAAAVRPLASLADKEEDPFLRLASVWALVKIQPGNERLASISVPVLVEGLSQAEPLVQQEIAETLGEMGAAAASAKPALSRLLEHRDRGVRAAAEAALEQIGE